MSLRHTALYVPVELGGSSPQTISVNAANETDLAQAITVVQIGAPQSIGVDRVNEANLAQEITVVAGAVVIELGQVIDTGESNALQVQTALSAVIGQIVEADIAQDITPTQVTIATLGQVTETDLTQAIGIINDQLIAVAQAEGSEFARQIFALVDGVVIGNTATGEAHGAVRDSNPTGLGGLSSSVIAVNPNEANPEGSYAGRLGDSPMNPATVLRLGHLPLSESPVQDFVHSIDYTGRKIKYVVATEATPFGSEIAGSGYLNRTFPQRTLQAGEGCWGVEAS